MTSRIILTSHFWRIFAGITFVNQLIRVPLLLSFAVTIRDLEVYFIITATSIPVQFVAHDVLQYRDRSYNIKPFEFYGLPLLIIGSILYVAWHYGSEVGLIYLIYALALILYSWSVGLLRAISSARRVLAVDAVYNTVTTILACVIAIGIVNTSDLGLAILLTQAFTAICMAGFNCFLIKGAEPMNKQSALLINGERIIGNTLPLTLAGIMVVTQLERLIIAASQPIVLACISLAAGATQAIRKVGLDDAVVYEALRQYKAKQFALAMRSQLMQARKIFYIPLLLAILANFFIFEIAEICAQLGVFRSLTSDGFAITANILCIYLASIPPGLIVINTLRLRIVPLKGLGKKVLGGAIVVLCFTLFFPGMLTSKIDVPLTIIILNATLFHVLFMALCPIPLKMSFRLLLIDFIVLQITVLIIWLLPH